MHDLPGRLVLGVQVAIGVGELDRAVQPVAQLLVAGQFDLHLRVFEAGLVQPAGSAASPTTHRAANLRARNLKLAITIIP